MTATPTPTRGALRVWRGAVLAVTSATLTVTAHTMAGGMPPDTGLTVLLTVGVAAVGVALADRQRSAMAILAVLAVAQLASHVLLSLGTPAMSDMPGMADMSDMGGMPGMQHVNGLAMLAAHTIAVLLSAALLARADAAIFLFAAVLAMLLPRLLLVAPPPAVPVARVRPTASPRDTATSVLLRRSHGRRGPPVSA